jgi:hypothetical protein
MTAPVLGLLVLAKAPEPGRVKTRLCPPLVPAEAADLAAAALLDTLDAACRVPGGRGSSRSWDGCPPPLVGPSCPSHCAVA